MRRRQPWNVRNVVTSGYKVAKAAGSAYKAYRNYQSKAQGKATSARGVTTQYDRSLIYRRKRMPWRKKRSWVNFNKRVRAVQMKNVSSTNQVFSGGLTLTCSGTTQVFDACHLYGGNGIGASEPGSTDLTACFVNDNPSTTAAKTLHFESAVLDVTITNHGFESHVASCELDIYEILVRKRGDFVGLKDLFNQSSVDTPDLGGSTSALTLGSRGCTPFQIPLACSWIKIIKKTKYFLGVGNTCTYQVRLPRNKKVRYENAAFLSYAVPGWTRSLLFVAKNVVGSVNDAQLHIGITRTYCYRPIKENHNYEAAIP